MPQGKTDGRKRRQHYINNGFQIRFMAKFIFILVLGGVISVGLTLFNTKGSLTSTYVDSRLVIENTSLAIMPSVIYTTLITTLLIGLLGGLVTLLVSHKIAGPMYRFEADIERVAKGDLKSRIQIREGDQFQDLAVSLNKMIEALHFRVSALKKEVQDLDGDGQAAARIGEKLDEHFKF